MELDITSAFVREWSVARATIRKASHAWRISCGARSSTYRRPQAWPRFQECPRDQCSSPIQHPTAGDARTESRGRAPGSELLKLLVLKRTITAHNVETTARVEHFVPR